MSNKNHFYEIRDELCSFITYDFQYDVIWESSYDEKEDAIKIVLDNNNPDVVLDMFDRALEFGDENKFKKVALEYDLGYIIKFYYNQEPLAE